MPPVHRVFHPRTNAIARAIVIVIPLATFVLGAAAWEVQSSPYLTSQDITIEQPIPFSHAHHVGGLGIDCRYCHASVAESSFAGMPSAEVCMSCHSQIWTNAPMLQPLRDSWRDAKPIAWQRVNALPDYVYFDHSAHVAKGVGCVSCHGQVDQMPLMRQATSMTMSWCLECHRHPEKQIRPREDIFNLNYVASDQAKVGRELLERYAVRSVDALTNCGTCHR